MTRRVAAPARREPIRLHGRSLDAREAASTCQWDASDCQSCIRVANVKWICRCIWQDDRTTLFEINRQEVPVSKFQNGMLGNIGLYAIRGEGKRNDL